MFADHKLMFSRPNTLTAAGGYSADYPNEIVFTTAVTAGTNKAVSQVIDLFNSGVHGNGQPIRLRMQITEAFAAGGTLDFRLEASASADMSTPTLLVGVDNVASAIGALAAGLDLLEGYNFLSNDALRYIRLEFDVNTTAFSAGRIWGGVIVDDQSS